MVKGRTGATYRLSDTLSLTSANLTLDLQGATLAQVNPTANMAAYDAVLDLHADGITVRNGSIVSMSPFQGSSIVAGKVRVVQANGREVDALTIKHLGAASSGVLVYFGTHATLRGVQVSGASIVGLGAADITIDGCGVAATAAGANGILLTAYKAAPLNDIAITNNDISGYGRWGMEITLDSGGASPADIARPTISGNRIGAPQAAALIGAISCLGFDGTISNNVITDPLGYGIELSSLANVVSGNQIIRSHPPAANDPGYGIVVDGHDTTGSIGPATIANNTVARANYGVYGANSPGPFIVQSNTIENPLIDGISLAYADPGAKADGNILQFTEPGISGTPRVGIAYSHGALITSNQLTYEASSVSAQTTELPLYGPTDATVSGNTIKQP